ncbi:MAG: hypothetical protein WAQ05_11765, partial [Rubrivivax sp.]
ASWQLTLGEWLPTLGLTPAQWQGMLLPWGAALHNGDIAEAMNISARAAMVFAAKALPDKPTDPIVYNVLANGMAEALLRMVAQFSTVQLHTSRAVDAVLRLSGGGFRLFSGGAGVDVDDLVFAASGEPTQALLNGLPGAALQRAALQGIQWFDTRMMLHTDPVYAPGDPRNVSFLNCAVQGNFCEASMSMAHVLPPAPGAGAPPALWKSWVTHRQALPTQVLHEAHYRHLLPTPASIRAQDKLRALQGQGGVWFAGGYTHPYDSQETALLSAMAVADGLGVATARRAALRRR